jgi:hypothetical protein
LAGKQFLALVIAIGALAAHAVMPGISHADGGLLGGVTESVDKATTDVTETLGGTVGQVVATTSTTPGEKATVDESSTVGQAPSWNGISLGNSNEPTNDGTSTVSKNSPSTLAQTVETVAQSATAPVIEATQPVATAGEPVSQAVATTTPPLAEAVNQTATPAQQATQSAVQPLLEAAAPVTEAVGGVVRPIVGAVEPVLQPVIQAVEPVLQPVVEAVQPVVDAAAPVVQPIVDAVAPVIEVVTPIVDPIVDVLPPALEAPAREPIDLVPVPSVLAGSVEVPGVPTIPGNAPSASPSGAHVASHSSADHPALSLPPIGMEAAPSVQAGNSMGLPSSELHLLSAGDSAAARGPATTAGFSIIPGKQPTSSGLVAATESIPEGNGATGTAASTPPNVAASPSVGGGPNLRVDWPAASLPSALSALLAMSTLLLLAVTGASPRTWLPRPDTPPA